MNENKLYLCVMKVQTKRNYWLLYPGVVVEQVGAVYPKCRLENRTLL